MAKEYWHTKTLFLQNWKYYKWSYKFDNCQNCWTCDFKHKWRWLCTSCFDKERKVNSKKRLFNLAKQNWKHYYRKRVELFLTKTEHKKKKVNFTKEMQVEYKKEWYKKNSERISIIRRWEKRKKKWLPCLEYITSKKTIYLPFEGLEKPWAIFNWEHFTKEYLEWKENYRQFNIIFNYYANNNTST